MSSQSAMASTEHSGASAGDDLVSEPLEPPSKRRARAREVLEPALNAGRSVEIWTWTEHEHLYGELRDEIEKQIEAVRSGDMSGLESILVGETVTLDQIFHSLCRRSGRSGHPEKITMMLQAALKTQAAIRATVQTLVLLKSPPSVNVVSGNLTNIGEVNLNRDLRLENAPSKLLEATNDQRLDTLTASITGGEDQELVTVGEIDRTEVA
jgi:hypothetical protein